jgi:hypothetical protein
MLRTFDFAVKGAANKSAQGIALGGVGIAVGVTRRTRGARRGSPDLGVTRRTRGARRGSPDPAGLPDRQVSRAHRRPRFQRSSCLLSLRQNEGDLSVKHLGGVRRPAPSAGAFQGGVHRTTAQHQNWRVGLVRFYSSRLRKRSAFTMTETELKVMARLAIIGLKRIPNQG